MKWFKFYGTEYLSDPKMLALTASERSCLITLLSYASVAEREHSGYVEHLNEEQLMSQSGIAFQTEEWTKTVGVLEKLKNLKIVTRCNGVITLPQWHKRQETNLTGAERVQRHRAKKRRCNADVTTEEIRGKENRLKRDFGKQNHLLSEDNEIRENATYLQKVFMDIAEEDLGTKPIYNKGGYVLLCRALKKFTPVELRQAIRDWFEESKKDEDLVQITQCLSDNRLNRWKINNK